MLSVLLQIQDTASTISSTGLSPAPVESLSWFALVAKGGPVMIPIAILLLLSIYVWIYKFITINSASKIDERLIPHVKDQLVSGNLQAAQSYTNNTNTSLARVIGAGLDTVGRPIREIESNLETASNIELMQMEKHLGILGIIAGIAPMLGFIGTIIGVIRIFYDISLSNDDISISIISAGLYQKMITSGFGLLTGIIAYGGYHLMNMKIDRIALKLQKGAFDFLKIINSEG